VPRLADPAGWSAAVLAHCGLLPNFAQSAAEWRGLRSAYAEPARLGIDRWLAMVALWQQLRGPFVVVSAGTALTVDRVAADGRHRGGIIAPGYGSTLASLLKITATPGDASAAAEADHLGTSSESAIRQGALFSALGAVERCLQLPDRDPQEARILTGGDATALQAHLSGDWSLRPELVLEGLLALATAPA
jgi:type III pantothenate kinase